MLPRAFVESITVTFVSNRCFYCEDPWKYKLEVAVIAAETKELTGDTVDIMSARTAGTPGSQHSRIA